MKKNCVLFILCLITKLSVFGQWTTNGNNVFIDKNIGIGTSDPQYKVDVIGNLRLAIPANSQPIYGVDIAVKSFATPENARKSYYIKMRDIGAGENVPDVFIVKGNRNVGIGTSDPVYRLDVNGSMAAGSLYLKVKSVENNWRKTFLEYDGHDFIIGSKEGVNAHNQLVVRPAGAKKEQLRSAILLYSTTPQNEYQNKVLISTEGNSFFNGGNVGIGTNNPQYKLDVNGSLNIKSLNCFDTSSNSLKSVLARLSEGNNEGEGTYLGVRSYYTQVSNDFPEGKVKSFSLEHKFYGRINSSINFYRGGGTTGGYISIDVYDGKQIAKFHLNGFDVAGTIKAREIKVEVNAGADHVFNPNYELKPLSEVEAFVKKNKHLPEIQSEKQMKEEGLNVNEFQIKLLQKIEELTLYVIDLKKENEEIKQQLNNLK